MKNQRWFLLILRAWWTARERRHHYLAAVCEEKRRRTIARLAMCDAPRPARPMRYRRWLRLFWES